EKCDKFCIVGKRCNGDCEVIYVEIFLFNLRDLRALLRTGFWSTARAKARQSRRESADNHGHRGGSGHARPARSRRREALACAQRRSVPHVYSRSEEHTSELQSRFDLVCRLLLEKKKKKKKKQ